MLVCSFQGRWLPLNELSAIFIASNLKICGNDSAIEFPWRNSLEASGLGHFDCKSAHRFRTWKICLWGNVLMTRILPNKFWDQADTLRHFTWKVWTVFFRLFADLLMSLQGIVFCRHIRSRIFSRNRLYKRWKTIQGQCSWCFQNSSGKFCYYVFIFHIVFVLPLGHVTGRINANVKLSLTLPNASHLAKIPCIQFGRNSLGHNSLPLFFLL